MANLNDWIAIIQWNYEQADYWGIRFGNSLYNAGVSLKLHDYDAAGDHLKASRQNFSYFRDSIMTLQDGDSFAVCHAFRWIRDNWPAEADPYDLTMADIISTMLTADSEEVRWMVGLIDAYRQSIWKQPFNREFYAGLAKGFEQWE